MKQEISFNSFCNAFKRMGREDNFSFRGKELLYKYLIEFEEDTGQEIELDIIALCCDYTEFNFLDDYLNNYYSQDEIDEKLNEMFGINQENDLTEEQRQEFNNVIEEEISEKTTLIKFSDDLDDGFIIQNY